MKHKNDHH